MERMRQDENTARVLAVGLALWAVAVGAATAEGVFDRMAAPEFAALAIFASLYAPATYRIDRRIREFALARTLRSVAVAAIALDAILVAAYAMAAPWPLIAFFGIPLALVTHFALFERVLNPKQSVRSGSAKSPDGRQAAI
jgi:hypothetical protein